MQFKKLLVYNRMQGLSRSETVLLSCVWHLKRCRTDGVVKVSDLVHMLEIPAPSVSRSLRSLEQKGMLKRSQSAEDRRVTLVTLTAEGERQLALHREKVESRLNQLIDRFGRSRTETFIGLMDAFYAEAEAMSQTCGKETNEIPD